ncbi:histone-lysine N-methyltransferase set1 isoform X2 [Chironomus tepperi]|uniref:histone-lysine N-methyltransferase set1 isoform X2 n=1 Tax=Chironomus tepperi TaxID=113505 RepID=UPI00391FC9D0
MQVDKNLSFDQFSHDLTLALLEEETLRGGTGSRWGLRRRTRSTGNLPCPPQPTEDSSSSSPTDPPTNNDNNNNDNFTPGAGANNNSILSDSDDRHSFALAFKLRQTPMSGNFESDSLNENFSPSRPNIRRKRKFKRMAVEYETTPSTPHTTVHPIFPISGTVTKKRVLKHNQENFRSNLFFGKRKRPHRDRYEYYESHKHSSSVPRQRGYLSQKDGLSYLEYKSRNRASSMSTTKSHGQAMEKILPLNKSIVSKIEKISQDSRSKMNFNFTSMPVGSSTDQIDSSAPVVHFHSTYGGDLRSEVVRNPVVSTAISSDMEVSTNATDDIKISLQKMTQKSGSFESALPTNNAINTATTTSTSSTSSAVHLNNCVNKIETYKKKVKPSASSYGYHANTPINNAASHHHHHHHHHSSHHHHHHKHKQSRRKMQLQFDDQTDFMDCGNFNDFLSSSSLSSSDSEAEETNESDHEGDDELTDWPGHEAMINFASKNEFKRANKKASTTGVDDDTLMSADEAQDPTTSEESPIFPLGGPQTPQAPHTLEDYHRKYGMPSNRIQASHPINIIGALDSNMMQGETSNHFLSSPNTFCEVREIRAGCRRVRDERPGFSIITSFNEDLLKFLQDDQQRQLKIFDIQEYDKILELAKLYSLNIARENGCILLTKTSNTMQAVKVSKEHNKYFFSDYKRRCVGGDTE